MSIMRIVTSLIAVPLAALGMIAICAVSDATSASYDGYPILDAIHSLSCLVSGQVSTVIPIMGT